MHDYARAEEDLVNSVTAKLNGSNLQQQDDLAVAQNGGLTGSTAEDAEMADAEGDDGMDDDMMDKISSSPSIDDGGYSLPKTWPLRSTSLCCEPATPPPSSQACSKSSSPYLVTPEHFPLCSPQVNSDNGEVQRDQGQQNHHLLGEYPADTAENEHTFSDYDRTSYVDPPSPMIVRGSSGPYHQVSFLDPFSDDTPYSPSMIITQLPGTRITIDFNVEMTVPYESESLDEDDDFEIPYNTDSRFVDSGWGGECLREIEDIDFEFVYALHTFVATVEGQANATKGDTMVLLDDSNSYWWLVRVVKDSSIGKLQ